MLIAVDVDDVLADFNASFLNYHNHIHGTSHTRDMVHNYAYEKVFGGSADEWLAKVCAFYDSSHFDAMPPVARSVEIIPALAKQHDLVVITARPNFLAAKTKAWLNQHYRSHLCDIHFAHNYHMVTTQSQKKADICTQLGVNLLIDDSLAHAQDCLAAGIPVLLFDAPWNQTEESAQFSRVKSWHEVLGHID